MEKRRTIWWTTSFTEHGLTIQKKIFFVRLTEFCFRYKDFFSSISFRSPKIWFWMEKFQKKKTKQHINTQNHT